MSQNGKQKKRWEVSRVNTSASSRVVIGNTGGAVNGLPRSFKGYMSSERLPANCKGRKIDSYFQTLVSSHNVFDVYTDLPPQ